jgi:ribulose 1,5-bisphosphate synthetase/thiazole synthase
MGVSSSAPVPNATAKDRLRDVVVIGAGPSGLTFTLQLLECFPELKITIYEKHPAYVRDHAIHWKPKQIFKRAFFRGEHSEWLQTIRSEALRHSSISIQTIQQAFAAVVIKKGVKIVEADITSMPQVPAFCCAA